MPKLPMILCLPLSAFIILSPAALAEFEITKKTVLLELSASTTADADTHDELDENAPAVFERNTVVGVANGGIASSHWIGKITFTESADALDVSGVIQEDLLSEDDGPTGPSTCSNADARSRWLAEVQITVSGDPVAVSINTSATHTVSGTESGCGGSAFARFRGLQIRDLATNEILSGFGAAKLCGTRVFEEAPGISGGPDECAFDTRDFSTRLLPGVYTVQVSGETNTGRTASAIAVTTWTLNIGPPPPCDLIWNEFGAGGLLSDENNWSPPRIPQDDGTGCQNLIVDRAGVFTIGISEQQAANSFTLNRGNATLFSSTGGTLSLSGVTGFPPGLGVSEGGDMVLNGTTVNAARIAVGTNSGGDGTSSLQVTGPQSRLSTPNTAILGDEDVIQIGGLQPGLLEILNGGAVSCGRLSLGLSLGNFGGEGNVVLRGASGSQPSQLTVGQSLVIGDGRTGTIHVEDGGTLTTLAGVDAQVGAEGGGELTVTGTGPVGIGPSLAQIGGAVLVGGAPQTLAFVSVENHGRLTADTLSLGDNGGQGSLLLDSEGEVTVVGETLVGGAQLGVLSVDNGAKLTTESLHIGTTANSGGSVEVTGPATGVTSEIQVTGIEVGSGAGRGQLRMSGSSLIRATRVDVPFGENAEGIVTAGDDAFLNVEETVFIGKSGTGEVTVGGLSTLRAGVALEVGKRGRFVVKEAAQVLGPRVRAIEPGGKVIGIPQRGKQADNSPALIEGDLELGPGATLSLEANPNGEPTLMVGGNLDAGGNLEVLFPEGTRLNANDRFDVLIVMGTVTGNFENITFPGRSATFDGKTTFESGALRIEVVNPGEAINGGGNVGGGCGGTKWAGQKEKSDFGDGLVVAVSVCLLAMFQKRRF